MKRLVAIRDGGKRETIATFKMVDGKLVCRWFSNLSKMEMEYDGILVGSKRYTPADGEDFYKALDHAFAQSSRLIVVNK